MTTKHTKGPWVYNKQQRHQNFIEIQHLDQSAGASSLVIARVVVRQTWKQEQEANARLIAAAPDLLEALQELIFGYKNTKNTGLMDIQVIGQDIINAVAAIAKATGGQE